VGASAVGTLDNNQVVGAAFGLLGLEPLSER
jgi:hypothetical protein